MRLGSGWRAGRPHPLLSGIHSTSGMMKGRYWMNGDSHEDMA